MTTGLSSIVGYAPVVTVTERSSEQAKYETMWAHAEYRAHAPGEGAASLFLGVARPRPGSTVIDFGAGTGRGALMLALLGNVRVEMVDFASNCLDEDVRNALTTQAHALAFTQADLTQPIALRARYGFCTDVMEHIPTEDVDRVLRNILQSAQHVYFQISCVDDSCGKLIGETLHHTVRPPSWWLTKFHELECVVHHFVDQGSQCTLYVTAWATGKEVEDKGVLNVEESTVRANVRANIEAGWQQIKPYVEQDTEVMILGGGPSLVRQLDMIRGMRIQGAKLVTLNGAYNWALANNLKVSAQVVVDARPFNARFTHPVQEETLYLLGSQCDPSVFADLPRDRTWLWHTSAESIADILNEKYEWWFGIPGGCTVLLRAIPLLRMLGYKSFHLFGCDSCLQPKYQLVNKDGTPFLHGDETLADRTMLWDDKKTADEMAEYANHDYQADVRVVEINAHHAYAQPENDGQLVLAVTCGERVFHCHPWQVAQAQGFLELIKFMGDEFELQVYGDGLLAYILKHGAELDVAAEQLKTG